MLSKFLDPKNDFAFKKIFGTQKHKEILIHFLNDMIEFKDNAVIENVEFLKTIQDPEIAFAKQSIVDILCLDQEGRKYIVEMQVANSEAFVKRAQYYASRAYSSQMAQGEAYHNLKEIIFLAITNFVMFEDKLEYKSDHVILDKKTYAHDLKDFYFCFLELPKFKKKFNELTTIVEKWAYFFKFASRTAESELNTIIGKDPVIGKAYEALNQYAWTPDDLDVYEQAVKRERDALSIINQKKAEGKAEGLAEGLTKGKAEGLAEGIEKGKAEGAKQASIQFAQNMLIQGMSPEQIQNMTGLSPQEIADLASTSERL